MIDINAIVPDFRDKVGGQRKKDKLTRVTVRVSGCFEDVILGGIDKVQALMSDTARAGQMVSLK